MAAGVVAPPAPSPPARPAPQDVARPRVREGAAAPAPPAAPSPGRDVALDLVRGLAMVILVVNHVHLESGLEQATRSLVSAAEMLVAVSGVVVGMVFGRRWLALGARATTRLLLQRARTLYVASVAVVALVGALSLVPGLATDVLAISPRVGVDTYAHDGALRTAWAIATLEAGPWQFNILGFFVAVLAAAPAVLWALERGRWPWVLAASWALYLLGRATAFDVLPSQSERPFPLLVWQLLFVHGIVLGWHRERLAAALGPHRRRVAGAVVAVALAVAYVRLHGPGFDPLGLDRLLGWGPQDWARWEDRYFDKGELDPARLITMTSLTTALYLAFRRWTPLAERTLGRWLLPLGRSSFYVFIVHVFLCLAVATLLAGAGPGGAANAAIQVAGLGLLVAMVRRGVLFRWIPR